MTKKAKARRNKNSPSHTPGSRARKKEKQVRSDTAAAGDQRAATS